MTKEKDFSLLLKQEDSAKKVFRTAWLNKNPQSKELPKTAESITLEAAEHYSRGLGIENEEKLKDRLLKNIMFGWVILVTTSYLFFVGRIITFLSKDKIALLDSVVITLLATTTTTIIGLPALILYSLFPKDKAEKKSKTKKLL